MEPSASTRSRLAPPVLTQEPFGSVAEKRKSSIRDACNSLRLSVNELVITFAGKMANDCTSGGLFVGLPLSDTVQLPIGIDAGIDQTTERFPLASASLFAGKLGASPL